MATEIITRDQIDEIKRLLVQGMNQVDILEQSGLDRKVFDRGLKIVLRELGAMANFDFEAEKGLSMAQLEDLYNKSLHAMEFKVALDVRKEKNRLLKLDKVILEKEKAARRSAGGLKLVD